MTLVSARHFGILWIWLLDYVNQVDTLPAFSPARSPDPLEHYYQALNSIHWELGTGEEPFLTSPVDSGFSPLIPPLDNFGNIESLPHIDNKDRLVTNVDGHLPVSSTDTRPWKESRVYQSGVPSSSTDFPYPLNHHSQDFNTHQGVQSIRELASVSDHLGLPAFPPSSFRDGQHTHHPSDDSQEDERVFAHQGFPWQDQQFDLGRGPSSLIDLHSSGRPLVHNAHEYITQEEPQSLLLVESVPYHNGLPVVSPSCFDHENHAPDHLDNYLKNGVFIHRPGFSSQDDRFDSRQLPMNWLHFLDSQKGQAPELNTHQESHSILPVKSLSEHHGLPAFPPSSFSHEHYIHPLTGHYQVPDGLFTYSQRSSWQDNRFDPSEVTANLADLHYSERPLKGQTRQSDTHQEPQSLLAAESVSSLINEAPDFSPVSFLHQHHLHRDPLDQFSKSMFTQRPGSSWQGKRFELTEIPADLTDFDHSERSLKRKYKTFNTGQEPQSILPAQSVTEVSHHSGQPASLSSSFLHRPHDHHPSDPVGDPILTANRVLVRNGEHDTRLHSLASGATPPLNPIPSLDWNTPLRLPIVSYVDAPLSKLVATQNSELTDLPATLEPRAHGHSGKYVVEGAQNMPDFSGLHSHEKLKAVLIWASSPKDSITFQKEPSVVSSGLPTYHSLPSKSHSLRPESPSSYEKMWMNSIGRYYHPRLDLETEPSNPLKNLIKKPEELSSTLAQLAIMMALNPRTGGSDIANLPSERHIQLRSCFTYGLLLKRVKTSNWQNIYEIQHDFLKTVCPKNSESPTAMIWIFELLHTAFDDLFFKQPGFHDAPEVVPSIGRPIGARGHDGAAKLIKYVGMAQTFGSKKRTNLKSKIVAWLVNAYREDHKKKFQTRSGGGIQHLIESRELEGWERTAISIYQAARTIRPIVSEIHNSVWDFWSLWTRYFSELIYRGLDSVDERVDKDFGELYASLFPVLPEELEYYREYLKLPEITEVSAKLTKMHTFRNVETYFSAKHQNLLQEHSLWLDRVKSFYHGELINSEGFETFSSKFIKAQDDLSLSRQLKREQKIQKIQ